MKSSALCSGSTPRNPTQIPHDNKAMSNIRESMSRANRPLAPPVLCTSCPLAHVVASRIAHAGQRHPAVTTHATDGAVAVTTTLDTPSTAGGAAAAPSHTAGAGAASRPPPANPAAAELSEGHHPFTAATRNSKTYSL